MAMVKRKKNPKFIQGMDLKKGALHRQLGIPESEKIPKATLTKASKAKGLLGERARSAITLKKFVKRKKKKG